MLYQNGCYLVVSERVLCEADILKALLHVLSQLRGRWLQQKKALLHVLNLCGRVMFIHLDQQILLVNTCSLIAFVYLQCKLSFRLYKNLCLFQQSAIKRVIKGFASSRQRAEPKSQAEGWTPRDSLSQMMFSFPDTKKTSSNRRLKRRPKAKYNIAVLLLGPDLKEITLRIISLTCGICSSPYRFIALFFRTSPFNGEAPSGTLIVSS